MCLWLLLINISNVCFCYCRLIAAECEENSASSSREVNHLDGKSSQAADVKSPGTVEPPAKKSRLLGEVDISSPDIQRLIHAKSAHSSLVDDVCIIHILLLVKCYWVKL